MSEKRAPMGPSPQDRADRRQSLALFLGIAVTIAILLGLGWFVFGPAIAEAVAPGIGLRSAAMIAFGLALAMILVMAVVAGDGIVGELPVMVLGFFAFFIVAWLMIAWIF